jgi:LPXTG-site transpeptidase (sortase) family protein
MRGRLGGVAVALLLAVTGCAAQPATEPAPPAVPVPVATPQSTSLTPDAGPKGMAGSTPTEVRIPKIGAKSSLIPLGLNADETVQVPPVTQPMQAGWYDKAPTPGEVGPAVILGHVDGNKQPGIFFRLREMVVGDEVQVSRQDGTTARFTVTRVRQVAKKDFPTEEVYGDTDGPELRLITCGGVFDKSARSYQDNIIVFASLTT